MNYEERQKLIRWAKEVDDQAAFLRRELLKYKSISECREAEASLAEASFPLQRARALLSELPETEIQQ